MLTDVVAAVTWLIRSAVPGAEVHTGPLGPPTFSPDGDPGGPGDATAGRRTGAFGLFLHSVAQPADGPVREPWSERRDDTGRVVGRTAAGSRYDVRLVLTAWGSDPVVEAELLGHVLRVISLYPSLPAVALTGSLAKAGAPVPVRLAPAGTTPTPFELLTAAGQRPRAALDLLVTATFAPAAELPTAPPPERIALDAVPQPPRPPRPPDGDRAGRRRPHATITEGRADDRAGREAG